MNTKRIVFVALVLGLSLVLTGTVQADYNQAPGLDELVEAGEIPPIEERLPVNPLVIEPFEEIGEYGGTITQGVTWDSLFFQSGFPTEPLIRPEFPMQDGPPVPNIAEEWEFSEDGTELTVFIREGIRWSDGEDFTTEDLMFYFEDVAGHPETPESMPGGLAYLEDGETVMPEIVQVDDYTLKFVYPEPFHYAEEALTTVYDLHWPKHVLKEYHPDYNEDASWEDWDYAAEPLNVRGKVTLQPWTLKEWIEGERIVLERNPYYWKVDPAGNQLPYVDEVIWEIVTDRDTLALQLAAGQIDMDGTFVGLHHTPLFMQRREAGDFDVRWAEDVQGLAVYLNYDAEDEHIREMVREPNFRKAFSLALNRDEINSVLFLDQLSPYSTTYAPHTPYFEEEVAKLYADYDPERAAALLDEAGFVDQNGDGWRQLPTGERLSLVVSVNSHVELWVNTVEMMQEYMEDIGVEIVMDAIEHTLLGTRREEGGFEAYAWDFSLQDAPLGVLGWHVPIDKNVPDWHREAYEVGGFADWYDEYVDLVLSARGRPYEERVETMKQAQRIMAENVMTVYIGPYTRPWVVNNRVGNAPPAIARIDATGIFCGPMVAEQLYIRY